MESHWSLGTLIWLPIAFMLVVALVWAGVLFKRAAPRATDSENRVASLTMAYCCLAAAVGIIIGTAAPVTGMWPYKAEYHQWQHHGGTVTSIDKRLVSAGSDSMEEKFVVTFEGDAQQYGCQDTRCASVEEGDTLHLSCKRVWEWAATDGFDCRFVGYEPK